MNVVSMIVERKQSGRIHASVCQMDFEIFPGVYQTSVDTELMCKAVQPRSQDSVLEIGCGCGAVTLLTAPRCRQATGVDINPSAVTNALRNAERLGITNASFSLSDVFTNVTGQFDAIICNPPYNHHPAMDLVERMFWDTGDSMKQRFFQEVRAYLKKNGHVYFGWADFKELDATLPMRLAADAGLRYVKHFSTPSRNGAQCFYVIKLRSRDS